MDGSYNDYTFTGRIQMKKGITVRIHNFLEILGVKNHPEVDTLKGTVRELLKRGSPITDALVREFENEQNEPRELQKD